MRKWTLRRGTLGKESARGRLWKRRRMPCDHLSLRGLIKRYWKLIACFMAPIHPAPWAGQEGFGHGRLSVNGGQGLATRDPAAPRSIESPLNDLSLLLCRLCRFAEATLPQSAKNANSKVDFPIACPAFNCLSISCNESWKQRCSLVRWMHSLVTSVRITSPDSSPPRITICCSIPDYLSGLPSIY